MAQDNRITLNDASAVFTGGDDLGSVTTTVGDYYEGGSALSVQFTNADERSYTTNIGGTRDLSNATCWLLVKDNLVQTQALGGIKYVLFDGVNEIGYEVGGNDNVGLPLRTFYNSYRLDVSNSAAFFAHEFAGTEAALNKTAITGVGFGTQHLAKANGAIDNCFIDRLSFLVNGNYALSIIDGTLGTPKTLADTAIEDFTGGWGLLSNPQGKQYNIFGSVEWGTATAADTYFEEKDSQVTIIGTDVGAGNINMRVFGNATNTNLFRLENVILVNLGTASNWDCNDTNLNTFELVSVQIVDSGNWALPPAGGTSRKLENVTFVNSGTITVNTCPIAGLTISGCSSTEATVVADLSEIANASITSGGSNHATRLTSIGGGSMTWSCTTSGFDVGVTGSPVTPTATGNEDIFVDVASGTLTINIAAGATVPSIRSSGAIVNVVAGLVSFTFSVSPAITGYEYRIYSVTAIGSMAGSVELQGLESATLSSYSYNYTYSVDQPIAVQIISQPENDFEEKISYYTLGSTNQSVNIDLTPDINN